MEVRVSQVIEDYFIKLEWPFERLDSSLWRSQVQLGDRPCEIFVSTDNENWISFRTLVADLGPREKSLNLYEHLLRLNSLVPWSKFCVTGDGDIFLIIDFPTADMDLSEFEKAIHSLPAHLDANLREIQALVADPQRRSTLAPEQALKA